MDKSPFQTVLMNLKSLSSQMKIINGIVLLAKLMSKQLNHSKSTKLQQCLLSILRDSSKARVEGTAMAMVALAVGNSRHQLIFPSKDLISNHSFQIKVKQMVKFTYMIFSVFQITLVVQAEAIILHMQKIGKTSNGILSMIVHAQGHHLIGLLQKLHIIYFTEEED